MRPDRLIAALRPAPEAPVNASDAVLAAVAAAAWLADGLPALWPTRRAGGAAGPGRPAGENPR